jgi:hypothetical protein
MSLSSVGDWIWNDIAKTQHLHSPWAQRVFPMSSAQIEAEEAPLREEIASQHGATVALAYLDMKPLLLENVAISRFILMKQDVDLRMPLPEILTVQEAVAAASVDYLLTSEQKTLAGELLQAEYDWQEQMNRAWGTEEYKEYRDLISAMDRVSPTLRRRTLRDAILSRKLKINADLLLAKPAVKNPFLVNDLSVIPDRETLLAQAEALPRDRRASWIGRTCHLELLYMERDALLLAGGGDCTLTDEALLALEDAQAPVIHRYYELLQEALELPDV